MHLLLVLQELLLKVAHVKLETDPNKKSYWNPFYKNWNHQTTFICFCFLIYEIISQFLNVTMKKVHLVSKYLQSQKKKHYNITLCSLCLYEVRVSKPNSWRRSCHSPSQEITLFLWNPKIHYSFPNSPPLVHILSKKTPAHILLFLYDPF